MRLSGLCIQPCLHEAQIGADKAEVLSVLGLGLPLSEKCTIAPFGFEFPPRRPWPREASGLATGPSNLPRPSAPVCCAMGRFQHLKIALEETQVWGLSREMSLERQLQLRPPGPVIGGWGHPTEETLQPL